MWKLAERLVATVWMLRAPIALCALIFAGMAAINEIDSRHGRDSAGQPGCANQADQC